MTVTNSLTTQAIGSGSNKGEGILPQKVTAQSTTSGFLVNLKVTNGVASYAPSTKLRCWYTSSSFSLTAAQAVLAMLNQADYVDLTFNNADSGDVNTAQAFLRTIGGQYIYFWFDVPALPVDATLAADCVEI